MIEEKSLQSMVDELRGLNKHSTVAILDCILTGLRISSISSVADLVLQQN
ncbi:hypothetical protein FOXG_22523 [Fusarium oxysporum f. sp. lycopersici 4287]|uniref:Uncharacterized protein n=1 Tax=Fusarium oxysporum f. sp. lycopersici (strain 4287 / CBS 123668 / FGSC 9935 / NRRL 34936) TaxID=426428 RepID=A0A0J9WVD0_FUSO4|nr:hypothetical protein FOXG_22523 [Fusarium oxysporum f. sp. lycopersici 4287]EWZ77974.1 hypothetical protein FOWG_17678 [Fusarium oxysporum f. sp. lycopersici MN25]KNB19317.1 hypothetical protein FOXG_22523 [Fusarium oxysporum f. sp. lycopersici 4287]